MTLSNRSIFTHLKVPGPVEALSRRHKQFLMVLWDGCAAPVSLLVAVGLRHGIGNPWIHLEWWELAVIAAITPPIFWTCGLYREITRYIGPRFAWLLAKGCMATAILFAVFLFAIPDRGAGIPRTSVAITAILMFMLAGGARLLVRHMLRTTYEVCQRVAIFGAGDAGAGLMSAISQDRATAVVAFFDDNASLAGGSIRGVRIHPVHSILEVLRKEHISTLLVALAPKSRAKCGATLLKVTEAGIRVLAVPTLSEIKDGRVNVNQLRPVALEDLLGRAPVAPDSTLLGASVTGKTVLITGAGGSIGSELCRQVLALGPKSLVLVDNSEFNLFEIDSELSRSSHALAPGSSRSLLHRYLASVTDAVRIDQILAAHRPDTIYHAAAYKHVPIVEDNESEGAEVNVLGTLRVAEAAMKYGVRNFVFVSTDKAVRPTSVMGATKRMAEVVLQALQDQFGQQRNIRFTMVRFGNVLGSSGSVVPIFTRQIESGGPVTVTHEEVTRYFMTIPEAAQLILQAGSMGKGGDVFVLDMGDPVRIADLARNMIRLAGRSVRDGQNPKGEIELVFTGLRPGEKMFEELVIGAELQPTQHAAILRAQEAFEAWPQTEERLQRLEAAVSQHDVAGVRRLVMPGEVETQISLTK